MRCTKEEKRTRTSKILEKISNHKFLTTVIAMFISFSAINGLLIINFIKILERNMYIL